MFATKAKQEKWNKKRKKCIIEKQIFLLKQMFFDLEMCMFDMRAITIKQGDIFESRI